MLEIIYMPLQNLAINILAEISISNVIYFLGFLYKEWGIISAIRLTSKFWRAQKLAKV